MKSLMTLVGFAVCILSQTLGFAQADAQMLCQRYAKESGLADEEIEAYVADCMVNLSGTDPAATHSDDVESEAEMDSASQEGLTVSGEEYDSDQESSVSVEEYIEDEEKSESVEEYASDEEVAASVEVDRADETTAAQAMDTVAQEDDIGYASDPGVDEADSTPTSPFGEPR